MKYSPAPNIDLIETYDESCDEDVDDDSDNQVDWNYWSWMNLFT